MFLHKTSDFDADGFDAASPGVRRPRSLKIKRSRLKVGLALGAGAARGWSHIGVIEELAAHRIIPDIVAGTSIGAIVGGYYAADRLDALTAFALGLTKGRVFGLMDLSLSGLGVLAGTKVKKCLERELSDWNFDELPKSFATVATEVATGHEVWLRRGNLVDAIRASYALPGIFEPVQIDGRWLFDGALVNPVPVNVCRALGADLVIAVNIIGDNAFRSIVLPDGHLGDGAPQPDASSPTWHQLGGAPGIAAAMMDAFNIAQDRISRSRLAGDPPDVMINARNAHIGLFDFHRAEELIGIGREAARRALDDIAHHMAHVPQAAVNHAEAAE